MTTQKVWDLPVRFCHWGFVAIIIFQYLSAEVLDENVLTNTMQWHFYAGYTCIAIVIFRLSWGVFGTYYAKFSQFMVSPLASLAYLREKQSTKHYIGHNPAGAYSVVVLLTLILTQAFSGLFISDEIFNDGPYYGVLGDSAQDIANYLHHNVYLVLFAFIALHIGAILYYKLRHKQALTSAMITGKKEVHEITAPQESFPWIGLLISLLITAIAMYLLLDVFAIEASDDYYGY